MVYQDKYFKQDKNYILRAAQGFVEPQLLKQWVETAIDCYMMKENPMGLLDDFVIEIRNAKQYNIEFLRELYELLSAIYRFKRGDNQLEFIWDGRSHYEVYAEQWCEDFTTWTRDLSQHPGVYRAILKACVLQHDVNTRFLYYSIRKLMFARFRMTIGRNRLIKSA